MLSLGGKATDNTVYQLICNYEADGCGNIGFDDFLHLMSRKVTEKDSKSDIRKVFDLYDENKTGFISIINLRRLARDIGEDISEEELQIMLDQADKDRDGFVSSEEFYRVMTRFAA
jgi:Ca2+-binding EF-hand superfamily protein